MSRLRRLWGRMKPPAQRGIACRVFAVIGGATACILVVTFPTAGLPVSAGATTLIALYTLTKAKD
jgi:hypothetical protein